MRQYTSKEQTAKLIELGFEKPKSAIVETIEYCDSKGLAIGHQDVIKDYAYSIGELIEMLPETIESEKDGIPATFQITACWELYYTTYSDIFYYCNNRELIDALYDMVIKLKEEGVI